MIAHVRKRLVHRSSSYPASHQRKPTADEEARRALRRIGVATDRFHDIVRTRRLARPILNRMCFEEYFKPEIYDVHMRRTGHFRALEEALTTFREYINNSLLDVSTGTGEALLFLASFLNQHAISVMANDFTPAMIAEARKKLEGKIQNIQFAIHDIRRLPPDLRAQTVLCSQSVHDLPNPKKRVVESIVKATLPGGHIISLEEWPCNVTYSRHLTPEIQILLNMSETPIDMKRLRAMFVETYGLLLVEDGTFKIDNKHLLYGTVYKKPEQT